MTNEEAIEILKPLFEQCKGTDNCLGYIEHYFSKNEEKALDLAIQALEERPQDKPIIKCKDCKYQVKEWQEDKRKKEKGYWVYGCEHFGELMGYWGFGGHDDEFCSDAEQKGNAEND